MRSEWLSFPLSHCGGDTQADECGAVHAQRLLLVQRLFVKHFATRFVSENEDNNNDELSFASLFQAALSGYDSVSLLDDREHIKTVQEKEILLEKKKKEEASASSKCNRLQEQICGR